MTREEKRKRIKANCINCEFCPLYDAIPIGEYCFGHDADVERNYYIMFGKGEQNVQADEYIQTGRTDSGR